MNEYVNTMRKYIGHERLILVGAGVFLYKDGRILLQKRRDSGLWADHGGCVEIGETLEETAKRELFEETGLIAKNLEFFNVYSGKEMFYTYPNGDKVYLIGTFFFCEDFEGTIKPDKNEVLELKWFEIDKIPKEIPTHLKRPFDDFTKYIKERDKLY
jgi:8-oxo-dGTP pyrophosphatase MutT (NUDIX family)